MNIQKIISKKEMSNFFLNFGPALYLFSSLLFYFSWPYKSNLWGLLLVITSLLLLSSEILILFILPLFTNKKEVPPLIPVALKKIFYLSWGLAILALALYFLYNYLSLSVENIDKLEGLANSFVGRLQRATLFLFILTYIAALLLRLMATLNYSANNTISDKLQTQRQSYLTKASISILATFLFIVLLNYLSHLHNPILDLSPGYYSFSNNARQLIRKIDREVQLHVFLPELQAVKLRKGGFSDPEVYKITNDIRLMLEQLPAINTRIKLSFHNADLEAYESNEFGSISNGTIILRVWKKESHALGSEAKPYIERRVYVRSEKELNRLERDICRALVYVSSPAKNIYFTSSHGERYNLSGTLSRTIGMETLKEQLRFYNMNLKELSIKENWPTKIPKDADLLAIIGPTASFGKKAQDALMTYLRNGGALFISLETEHKKNENFNFLFHELGGQPYSFLRETLANTNLSNLLVTDNYETHSITQSLKNKAQAMVALPRHGYFQIDAKRRIAFKKSTHKAIATIENKKKKASEKINEKASEQTQEKIKEKPSYLKKESIKSLSELEPQILLHSPFNSYIDKNQNRRIDKDENRGRKVLGLAYAKADTPVSPKLVIYGGSDWLSERGMRFPLAHHNSLLASDSILWLLESPLTATITVSERPVRNVQVTAELKWKLMLFGMFVFPIGIGLLLGFTIIYYRRKHRHSQTQT